MIKRKDSWWKEGFGFKLVLIYSLWGTIETVDYTEDLNTSTI